MVTNVSEEAPTSIFRTKGSVQSSVLLLNVGMLLQHYFKRRNKPEATNQIEISYSLKRIMNLPAYEVCNRSIPKPSLLIQELSFISGTTCVVTGLGCNILGVTEYI